MFQLSPRLLIGILFFVGLPGYAQSPLGGLPDGSGKELVEAACVACHETDVIYSSTGYTHDQWRRLTNTMIDLPDPLASDITQYLASSFPEKYDRRPTLVPGDAKITFLEWTVPTLGQRPRDPVMTPDGMIWWAGMYGNLIGRLDPNTGEMTEWMLEPTAMPHSIINDAAGNIWYTGNGNGSVGKLNPDTGEITVYEMPDPAARDPHTGIFTRSGDYWFTLQNSNMLGRLVPDDFPGVDHDELVDRRLGGHPSQPLDLGRSGAETGPLYQMRCLVVVPLGRRDGCQVVDPSGWTRSGGGDHGGAYRQQRTTKRER